MHKRRSCLGYVWNATQECSTPFGDIDECTAGYMNCAFRGRFRICAQRLSATLMNARAGNHARGLGEPREVLNAFRRH